MARRISKECTWARQANWATETVAQARNINFLELHELAL